MYIITERFPAEGVHCFFGQNVICEELSQSFALWLFNLCMVNITPYLFLPFCAMFSRKIVCKKRQFYTTASFVPDVSTKLNSLD